MLKQLASLLTRREKVSGGLLILFMMLGATMETIGVGAIPAYVGVLNDPSKVFRHSIFGSAGPWLLTFSTERLALYGALFLFVYFVLKNIFLATLSFNQNRFLGQIQVRLATRLFEIYLRSPYTLHLQRNSAELLRNTNTDALDVVGTNLLPLLQLIMEVFTVAAIFVLLVTVEPMISLVAFLVLGGSAVIFSQIVRRGLETYGKQIQQYRADMIQTVNEGLGGVKVTKVYNRDQYFVAKYRAQTTGFARAIQYRLLMTEAPRLFLEVAAIAGLLTVAAMLLTQRQTGKVMPTLSLLAVAVVRLIPSFNRITSSVTIMRYGRFALATVYGDFRVPEETLTAAGGSLSRPRHFEDRIVLENLYFTFPAASRPAIRDVSLEIKRGEAVAFVGTTGAGKTTIADLLLGLLEPSAGSIQIDGRDLREDVGGWQRNIGYVPQEVYLSDDTITNNIAFGVSTTEIDPDAVDRAIAAAQLEDLIASLPEGVTTRVGERGIRLSGGQRQRIGIARALYHDPEVLILDEATSALDHETERYVMESVDHLRASRTIIMIAHRISTVRSCDRIFVLRDGELQQTGTYEELLQKDSMFRRLAAVES